MTRPQHHPTHHNARAASDASFLDWQAAMNHNQAKAIERLKAKHGGELPSDLYLRTNADLAALVRDLTGKLPSSTASKQSLIQRIERHNAKAAAAEAAARTPVGGSSGAGGVKRGADGVPAAAGVPAKKAKSSSLSAGATAEARRVLARPAAEWEERTTHAELEKTWRQIGMTAQYPRRSSKALVIGRLRKFAEKNLA